MDTGCLDILAIESKARVNAGVQIPLQDAAVSPFGHIPRSGIARSDGNSTLVF